MLDLSVGRIEVNQSTGQEYVPNFFRFRIGHLKTKNLGWEEGSTGVFKIASFNMDAEDIVNSDIDVKPDNIVEILRSAYGISDSTTNLSSLLNKKLYFFSEPDINSKLNFEFKVVDVNNSRLQCVFGDLKRGIYQRVMLWDANKKTANEQTGFEQYYLCINDLITGNSIDEILSSSKKLENTYFNNGLYNNKFCLSPYSPMAWYFNRNGYQTGEHEFVAMRYESGYTTPNGYGQQCSLMPNLSCWANWYTMLTGKYFYGNPFSLPLITPVNGIESIELGLTMSQKRLDEGEEMTCNYDSTTSNVYLQDFLGDHKTHGFSYFVKGTDITQLFDNDNNNTQQVFFEGGYIERRCNLVQNDTVEYSINNNYGKIATYCISRSYLESINHGVNINGSYLQDAIGLGIYVQNDFVEIPGSGWITEIPEDIEKFDYDTCPLYFGTFAINRNIKMSYIDEEFWTTEKVGLAMDFIKVQTTSNYSDFACTLNLNADMSYQFWETILEGFSNSGGVNVGGGSIGGGTSGTGGGQGGFDDSSASISGIGQITINGPSLLGGQVSGSAKILNAYVMNAGQLNSFAATCWDTSWDFEDIAQAFGNSTDPMSAILSVKYIPVTAPLGSATIDVKCAGKDINLITQCNLLERELKTINFGSITIPEYYGSFVDYDETRISIVLPFVGIQQLDAHEVTNGRLQLDAIVDFIDGSITYYLTLDKNGVQNVINSWRGMCGIEIPLSGLSNQQRYNGLIQGGVSIASTAINGAMLGLATGGPMGAAVGAASGLGTGLLGVGANFLSTRPSLVKTGNFNGSRASISRAYLIIERPKLSLPDNYGHDFGYPSNISTKLKYLNGYTVVGECHLQNMGHATSDEVKEIDSLLKSGVIL